MTIENDIPIEGVLKWLKRERDKLKEKLEVLKQYAKDLEQKNISLHQMVVSRDQKIEKQKFTIEGLQQELKTLKVDFKQSSIWQNKCEEANTWKERYKEQVNANYRIIHENQYLRDKLKENNIDV